MRKNENSSDSFSLYSLPAFGGEPTSILANLEDVICLSPDERQLAYKKSSDNGSEVHVVTLATGEDKVVYRAASQGPAQPAWSPDGLSLAWVETKDMRTGPEAGRLTHMTVTLFELNSKKTREVDFPNEVSFVSDLRWLPSRRQLLVLFSKTYSGFRDPGNQLGLISVGSGEFRQLTNDLIPHFGITLPIDGTTIATLLQQSGSEVGFYDRSGTTLISSTNAPRVLYSVAWFDEDSVLTSDPFTGILYRGDGRFGEIELKFPAGHHTWASLASSGSNMTPAACPGGEIIVTGIIDGVDQIYVMNSHGQFVKTLVKTKGSAMFCDRQSRSVYYFEGESKEPAIWSVPLAGGTPSKLMSIPEEAVIVYSSDGRFAAYVAGDAGNSTATLLDLDHRKVIRKIPLSKYVVDTLPHFTPEGRGLAYVEQQSQGFALAVQPLDGSAPRQMTTWFKAPIQDFGWSPSGRTLAIAWDRSTSDVALITDKSAKPKD